MDASLTMKDWVHRARPKRHTYEGSVEARNAKIARIREKKRYSTLGLSYGINESKVFLHKLNMIADNIVREEMVKNRQVFFQIHCFIGAISNCSLIPEDKKNSLLKKAESAGCCQP